MTGRSAAAVEPPADAIALDLIDATLSPRAGPIATAAAEVAWHSLLGHRIMLQVELQRTD